MMAKLKDKGRLEPFVPLLIATLDTPAWHALSHGAARLYVALRRRYSKNQHNNGRIFLSSRHARRELGSGLTQITRWFRELQHYGFIVMTAPGCLGSDGKGKAPHWRLTELGCRLEPPTRDFLSWKGIKFKSTKKQKPVPEIGNGVFQKSGTVAFQKPGTHCLESVPESWSIQRPEGVPEIGSVTRLTTLCDDLAPPAAVIPLMRRESRT
jgi:hypothetical protein